MTQEIAEKVALKFETKEGKVVDVLFGTSDGELFLDPDEAREAATKLVNQTIVPYYKDSRARDLSDSFKPLQAVVAATDVLKRFKAMKKKMPEYEDYRALCDKFKFDPVKEDMFDFIRTKVFRKNQPIATGQKDTIFMWKDGFVEAVFIRRYMAGQVWSYQDNLVFTCPTNTELMSGSYYDLFDPLLGKKPE